MAKKKIKKGIQVSYKELNNKSRKGTYAYVKEPKKAGKYYKVKKDIGRKDNVYKDIYKTGGFKSKKGVTKELIKSKRKSIKSLRKYPNIEESLKSGYAQTTVNNVQNLTPYGSKIAYMNLLKNTDKKGDGYGVVRDKQLLEILSLPENVQKWKHRVLYEVMVYNQDNEVVYTIIPTIPKTLGEIQKDIMSNLKRGQEVGSNYNRLKESFKVKGYDVRVGELTKGRVKNINIKMIFKKS